MIVDQILCPVDFSKFSRRAADYANVLAEAFGARLTMLHCFTPEVTFGSQAAVDPGGEQRRHLQNLKAEYPASPEVETEYLVMAGAPGPAIVEASRGCAADLIVLGTHGRSGLRRVLLGSVAEEVIRDADRPVMAITTPEESDSWQAAQQRSEGGGVACAIDAEDYDQRGVDLAAMLAAAARRPLDLVHVTIFPDVAERPGCYGSPSELIRDHDAFKQVRTQVPNVEVNYHHLAGAPAEKVAQFTEQQRPRLLVLGTHGRHGWRRLLGSTASRILRKVSCPVLVLRQDEDSSGEQGRQPATAEGDTAQGG